MKKKGGLHKTITHARNGFISLKYDAPKQTASRKRTTKQTLTRKTKSPKKVNNIVPIPENSPEKHVLDQVTEVNNDFVEIIKNSPSFNLVPDEQISQNVSKITPPTTTLTKKQRTKNKNNKTRKLKYDIVTKQTLQNADNIDILCDQVDKKMYKLNKNKNIYVDLNTLETKLNDQITTKGLAQDTVFALTLEKIKDFDKQSGDIIIKYDDKNKTCKTKKGYRMNLGELIFSKIQQNIDSPLPSSNLTI